MSLVRDATGRWWYTCEDPECPCFEHPEDMHSHQLPLGTLTPDERRALKDSALAELARRRQR